MIINGGDNSTGVKRIPSERGNRPLSLADLSCPG